MYLSRRRGQNGPRPRIANHKAKTSPDMTCDAYVASGEGLRSSRGNVHQRSTMGPSNAPAAVGMSMPATYQTPTNGASISGQCSA